MKTFEEALGILVQPLADQAQVKEKFEQMADVVEKYTTLAQEIGGNDDARALICTFLKPDAPDVIKDALLNVFINGVIVGMEMEKQS